MSRYFIHINGPDGLLIVPRREAIRTLRTLRKQLDDSIARFEEAVAARDRRIESRRRRDTLTERVFFFGATLFLAMGVVLQLISIFGCK